MLRPEHLALDYTAICESRSRLGDVFLGPWPDDVTSPAVNLSHIEEHYEDFCKRRGFTYTVLNRERTRCLGCIYIYPSVKQGYDITVHYWVHIAVMGTPFEDAFEAFLEHWIAEEWPLPRVAYPGRAHRWKEWVALPDRAELFHCAEATCR